MDLDNFPSQVKMTSSVYTLRLSDRVDNICVLLSLSPIAPDTWDDINIDIEDTNIVFDIFSSGVAHSDETYYFENNMLDPALNIDVKPEEAIQIYKNGCERLTEISENIHEKGKRLNYVETYIRKWDENISLLQSKI